MKLMIDFIQFIGTQRSGSNLLRLMLNQHPLISAHHPPHLLRTFVPLLPHYGDLDVLANRKLLVDDMVNWVKNNPVTWNIDTLDIDLIAEEASDITDIFVGIYRCKMKEDHAALFCCKSTFNVFYNHLIEKNYRPFYIYLYRDGRDVAASFKKAIVGPKHSYVIAEKWHKEQQKALEVVASLAEERHAMISYEQLIADPVSVLTKICHKIGLTFDPEMLNYHKSNESLLTAGSGDMWKNVARPIIKTNQSKYKSELSQEEILTFEAVAGESLARLGYEIAASQLPMFTKEEIEGYYQVDEQLRDKAQVISYPHDIALREPQKRLLAKIKHRFSDTLLNQ